LEDLYIGMKIKMSEINIARMTDPSICSKYLKIKEQKTIQRGVIQTHK